MFDSDEDGETYTLESEITERALRHGIQVGLLRPMLTARSPGIAAFPSSQHDDSNPSVTVVCYYFR